MDSPKLEIGSQNQVRIHLLAAQINVGDKKRVTRSGHTAYPALHPLICSVDCLRSLPPIANINSRLLIPPIWGGFSKKISPHLLKSGGEKIFSPPHDLKSGGGRKQLPPHDSQNGGEVFANFTSFPPIFINIWGG